MREVLFGLDAALDPGLVDEWDQLGWWSTGGLIRLGELTVKFGEERTGLGERATYIDRVVVIVKHDGDPEFRADFQQVVGVVADLCNK